MVENPNFIDEENIRRAGAGRHPSHPQTWIPFFNGMTDFARHLDSGFRRNDRRRVDFESTELAPLAWSQGVFSLRETRE